MLRLRRAGRGFNLIEVLTAVAVVGVVIALGAPAMGEYLKNQQVRAASDALQNGIQLARAEAIRRNLPVKITLGPGTGWTIREAASGASIQSRSQEEGTAGATLVTTPTDSATVTFTSMGGVLSKNADGTERVVAVDVKNPNAGTCQDEVPPGPVRCLKVIISGGGSVRMCDPSVAAADTRKCPAVY